MPAAFIPYKVLIGTRLKECRVYGPVIQRDQLHFVMAAREFANGF
jgi:hypothetical protein